MKKFLGLGLLCLFLSSLSTEKAPFSGVIDYRYSFEDINGNDVSEVMSAYLGAEQHYHIKADCCYKAYNEKGDLVMLYDGGENAFYSFSKPQNAIKYDGSQNGSSEYKVTKLSQTEEVAGYKCQSIKVETETSIITYFFSPKVKVDPQVFKKHAFGDWNRYLKATNGALPLKYVLTNKASGLKWTSQAYKVSNKTLSDEAFALPKGVQVSKG